MEHAFITNASDVSTYLQSENALKQLGKADARGIAGYYGLQKKGEAETESLAKTSITGLAGKDSATVSLKWKKADGASGYEIYRSTEKSGSYSRIKTIAKGSTVSYKDKSVKSGRTYYYKIRSIKNSGGGTQKSAFSGIQSVKVMKKPVISSIKSSSAGRNLKWKKVSGAVKYEIYRSTSPSKSFKKIAAVKNVTSYKDKKAVQKKTYYYKIRAVGKGIKGNSYSSNSAVRGR